MLLLSTTAAAVSAVLVFGHATNNTVDSPQVQLAASAIGIGGRGDPAAAKVQNKLQGNVVPDRFTYIPVRYPASFFIDNSVAAGVPVLDAAIKTPSNQSCDGEAEPCLIVVAYSEGTIVAENVRRNLVPGVDGAPPAEGLRFVMIASPNVPNGGIFARFPDLKIPFFVTSTGPAQPSDYPTTYVTNEYDPYADFPAYFNPLSLLNTLFAIAYVHPDQYYDSIDYDPRTGEHGPGVIVTPVTHEASGTDTSVTDTYVFVQAAHLPLLAPARQIFGALGLTPLTEPVLSAIEPVLRLLVDMGYTDRENLHPEEHVPFSLITPPARIIETIAKIPGALGQGVDSFATEGESIPGPVTPKIAPRRTQPPINAKSLPQEPLDSLVNNDPTPAGVIDPEPQAPSDPSTTPAEAPVSPLSKSRPKLREVTEDGNKVTPKTGKTTSPRKENVFTRLAEGLLNGKKAPASTTPSSEPNDPKPGGSTSEGQQGPSERHTRNAA